MGKIILDGIGGHAELARRHWDAGGPVDAIGLTRFVLSGIDVINERWRTDPRKNHPLMELPNQITVTQIKAGEHPSSAAGRSEIIIDVQYLPHEKDVNGVGGSVKKEVEDHLARISRVDPWLAEHPPRIEWILDADCSEVMVDHPIIGAFREATKQRRCPSNFGEWAPIPTWESQLILGKLRRSISGLATRVKRINPTSRCRLPIY